MANCLVTKLKEVVNDVEIPALGELIIKMNPSTGGAYLTLTSTVKENTIKILKGHLYADSACTTALPTENIVAPNYQSFEAYRRKDNSEGAVISISNKYNFYKLEIPYADCELNIFDLCYCDITELYLYGNPAISGDIEEFAEKLFANFIKINRSIDTNYPIYFGFSGTSMKFKDSLDWFQKTWGLTVIKDPNNSNVFKLYAAENDEQGYLLPAGQQYTRLAATYNAETKVWTYTDLFD